MFNFGKFRSSKDKKDDEDKKQETVEDEILGLRLKEQTLLEKLNLVRKELEGKKEQVDKLEVVEGLFARSGFKLCVKTDTGDGYDKVRYYASNVHVYIDDEDGNIISAETVQAVDFGRFVHRIYEGKDLFEKLVKLDFMKLRKMTLGRSTSEDYISCFEYYVEVESNEYIWSGYCTVKLFGDGTFDIRSYVYRHVQINKKDLLSSGVVREEQTFGLDAYTIYFTLNKENIASKDIVKELTTVYAKLKDAVLSDTVELRQ